jgi:recombination protein RecT
MSETRAIQKTTVETLSDLLRARKESIAQMVPQHLTAERLMRVAINCVAKTPGLQQCTPTSLLQSVLVAAELGLEPGGALGHLYLVPFKTTCTPIIGYRGFLELARRSGELASVRAVVVRVKDEFRLEEGIDQTIKHVPKLDGDAGALRYVYAVAKLKDGSVQVEVMSKHQVDAVRGRSRSGNSGPWVDDYDEMAKKTVFRRLAKWLPLSSERFASALERDDADYVDGEVVAQAIASDASSAKLKERVSRKMAIVDVPAELPAEAAAESVETPFVAETSAP